MEAAAIASTALHLGSFPSASAGQGLFFTAVLLQVFCFCIVEYFTD
jgi:hypothetical protein